MYRINEKAMGFSHRELKKFTEPQMMLDDDWFAALQIWADDPDMVVILDGEPLEYALANLGNATPRMSAAQMVLRHLRELANFQGSIIPGTRGDMKTPANLKMKCEIVGSKLWVWHKV